MIAVRRGVTVMVMAVATLVLLLRMAVVLLMRILCLHNLSAILDSELILSGDSHLRVLCDHDK